MSDTKIQSSPAVKHYDRTVRMQAKMAVDYAKEHKDSYSGPYSSQLNTDIAFMYLLLRRGGITDIIEHTKNIVDQCVFAEKDNQGDRHAT